MSAAMWEQLESFVAVVASDASVRVLVLCGTPAAFVSGADIRDFRAIATAAEGVAYERTVERVLAAIERLPCVTIAAVSGACTGGGAILAAACDLRLASADARVGVPIARTVGNITTARNLARLAAVVGRPRALAWILTAELSDAASAERCGFFYEIVNDFDALLARASSLARRVAANAPLTLRGAKELVQRLHEIGLECEDVDVMERCYGSEDFREGVAAFSEKRSAHFVGR